MGRSSKPTRLLVDRSLLQWDEIQALQAQGHEIVPLDIEHDLILSPMAWRMDESLRPYLLSHALPAARKAADLHKVLRKLKEVKGPMCSENGILGIPNAE